MIDWQARNKEEAYVGGQALPTRLLPHFCSPAGQQPPGLDRPQKPLPCWRPASSTGGSSALSARLPPLSRSHIMPPTCPRTAQPPAVVIRGTGVFPRIDAWRAFRFPCNAVTDDRPALACAAEAEAERKVEFTPGKHPKQ